MSSRSVTYSEYLRLDALLSLQTPPDEAQTNTDGELLFVVVHQATELWFKSIAADLSVARPMKAPAEATRRVHRASAAWRLLATHVEMLADLGPGEFAPIRAAIGTASGMQSNQFARLDELARDLNTGFLELVSDTAVGRPWTPEVLDHPLHALAEALLGYDQAVARWRFAHVLTVERVMGSRRTGTGGTTGARYLQDQLSHRYFSQLAEWRSALLGPRDGSATSSAPRRQSP